MNAHTRPPKALATFRPQTRLRRFGQQVLRNGLPPLVVGALLLIVWQLLCSRPGAALPPPSQVVNDTWELITQPFYDNGGNDVGMAWQLLASLERVAYGYLMAAVSIAVDKSVPTTRQPASANGTAFRPAPHPISTRRSPG